MFLELPINPFHGCLRPLLLLDNLTIHIECDEYLSSSPRGNPNNLLFCLPHWLPTALIIVPSWSKAPLQHTSFYKYAEARRLLEQALERSDAMEEEDLDRMYLLGNVASCYQVQVG